MWKSYVFVPALFSLVFPDRCESIIQSNQEQPKPSYTAGIKTAHWKNPNNIQTHHNYSRVYVHNNPDGLSQYVVTQTERTQSVYPVYNAHSYSPKAEGQNRVTEINPQPGHGHFASLIEGNTSGVPKANRTIYKRKIQYKTVDVYEKCPEGATGQFVYYLSCNQFLNCWKGRGQPQNCSPGTLFNPKTLECDFPDKVECITGPRQNTLQETRVQKSITQVLCPKEFTGLIPNYTDCSKFINCNNGQHTPMDCPPGTLFDINQNVCDFSHKATCFNAQSGQSGQYQVNGENVRGQDQNVAQTQQQWGGQNYNVIRGQNGQICNPQLQDCSYYHAQGQGQQGSGQFYQTHYGSTQGQHSVDSKLDFGSSGQAACTGTTCSNRPDQASISSQGYGQTSCVLGSGNCGSNFGQTTYTQSGFGSTTCNPLVQNCGNTGNTYSYASGQRCDPHTQDCRQVIGASQHTTTQQQYGQNTGNTQGTGYSFVYTQGCNPQTQNCGHSTNSQGQGGSSYHISGQSCNPRIQNCGQNAGAQHTTQSQGQGGFYYINGQLCNPQTQNCGQNIGDQQTLYTQGQGQTLGAGQGQGQSQGQGGSFYYINSQRCNPQTQNCGQNVGSSHTTHWQGQGQGQGHSQGQAQGQGYGTGYTQQTQVQGQGGYGQQNYNKVCNINDPNCHRQQNNTDTSTNDKKIKQPKCPSGFQGITQHPTDCKKFLNCANGQTFIQDCAPGTLFNPILGVCDFPYNVDCKHGEEEEATTVSDDLQTTDENWRRTYYEHAQRYGQNAGHGNIRQSTTVSPENQASSDRNYGTRYQGHGIYNQGHGTYPQGQTTYNQGHGHGIYGQGQSTYNQSETYRPLTPRPGHVTIVSTNEQTAGRDIDRGQIGVVERPKYNQNVDQNIDQNIDQSINKLPDYEDIANPNRHGYGFRSTSPRSVDKSWPPAFPETDPNADYVFEYEDGEMVTLEPENVFYSDKRKKTTCGKGDFECSSGSCISKTMVCDGQRDCQNGKDELECQKYLDRFTLRKNYRLDVLEKQRWMNVTYTTCALLCTESNQFPCRSFNYRKIDKTCFLSDSNIGLSGALRQYYPSDYYELKSASIDCTNLFKCPNDKCITTGQLCDGFDDCGDRRDEKNCKPEDFGYSIRLAGSSEASEGRVEITAFGKTGYICDDQFGIQDANVICRELGFKLGAAEFRGNSYYAKDIKENNTLYIMDDLECLGNETTLLDCGFSGWGVHNCRNQEIAGVACKTPQEKCGKGYWKCDTGNECVPFSFVCDNLYDCTDSSDEGVQNCEAPIVMRLVNGTSSREGRVEIKRHGIWGTVCDDDFNDDAAKVVCKYFGFKGMAKVVKDAHFGQGDGPIWLDQVSCNGDETELHKCTHWSWGEHNCDHSEDVGVICSNEPDVVQVQRNAKVSNRYSSSTGLPPISCGFRKDNQFLENDLVHARVVSGSVAKKGDYPWQAALRVKGKEKSAHWCGAVVISSRWVLTAAHCLQGYAKGAYLVVAGEYNTDEVEGTEQQRYIEEYFLHENFRSGHKMNNDIALIKLKGTGFALNQDVQPICLPEVGANYGRELNCTISGFGSVKSGTSAYSHNLMAAWVPVHSSETCKMPHVYGTALTEGMICAGFLDGGIDSCDGDSGGPLACLDDGLFTLYGLTSWGQHCGYANKPGVYVKVAYYRRWIDDIITRNS